jgi:hypothetical protein
MPNDIEIIKYDQDTAIASGVVSGVSIVNKFGKNSDVDIAAPEDVWSGGGLYPFQTSAQALEIVSDSIEDDSTGTGAFTVEVQGLDSNYNLQNESVDMDGTTAVDLAYTYIRVFRAKVLTSGTNDTNVGNITVRVDGAGATQAVIDAGAGQTLMAIYTIPAGKTGFIQHVYSSIVRFTAGQQPSADLSLFIRPFGGSWNVKHTWGMKTDGSGDYDRTWIGGEKATEKSDVLIRVNIVSVDDTSISAGFDIKLLDGNF